jgi:hypothetical protein
MRAAAFVVGINTYPEYARLTDLVGAVADAVDFADWALDPDGGNVAPADLRFWTWPPPPKPLPRNLAKYMRKPTKWFRGDPKAGPPDRSHITQSIYETVREAAVNQDLDRIYVFFAGHGIIVDLRNFDPPQSCFMAGDYVAGYSDGLIPCDDLQVGLNKAGPAEVVLIFDCCRSELSPTTNRPSLTWPTGNALGFNQHLVTARGAQPSALSFEINEGGHNPRGAFSRLVTFGLRHLRFDNRLTTAQLKEYVRTNIGRLVEPRKQEPEIIVWPDESHFNLVQGPPMKPDLPISVSFQSVHAGKLIELRDHQARKLAEIPANGAAWTDALPIGRYTLELPAEQLSMTITHLGPEPTNVIF